MALSSGSNPKRHRVYKTDENKNVLVLMHDDLATAGGFALPTSGTVYASAPRRMKMRKLHLIVTGPAGSPHLGKREECPIADPANAAYKSGSSSFAFEGVTCFTTGRTGEKQTFT